MGSDLQELYRRACVRFGEHVHAIRDDQWGSGTPCTEWDVKALVGHLITEVAWVPPLVGGRSVAEVGDELSGDLTGADPAVVLERFPHAQVELLVRPGQRLSENDHDVASHRLALVALAAPTREAVLARYQDAKRLLPFDLRPITPGSARGSASLG